MNRLIDLFQFIITDRFVAKAGLLIICFLFIDSVCAQSFITTWQTDNPGSSSDTQITIPTTGTGYDYNVTWFELSNPGNTGTLVNISGDVTIDFPSAGSYQVEIDGQFPRIYFNGGGDRRKLLTIEQWGDIAWSSMQSAFQGCSNLTISATDAPDLSIVTDMSNMFRGASALNSDFNNWDVSTVTNMEQLFYGASAFDGNISNWNTGNVTNMNQMFRNATAFNQPIGSWNVSNVTDMALMFSFASTFNQNINNWNVGNVTTMNQMFRVASVFNQPLDSWDVSSVTDMGQLFDFALMFNQDIGAWDVGNVTTMFRMFANSDFNFNINSWYVSSVTNMQEMFSGAREFNQPLDNWDVSNVTSMRSMFINADIFNQDLNSWDVSNVTDMRSMFEGAYSFNGAISNWNTASLTTFTRMFRNASAFNQPIDGWDVSSVSSLDYVFSFASAFNHPLNSWNVSNVVSMEYVFNWAITFDQDLNNWDVSNVTDMRSMFGSANAFNGNITSWDVSNVSDFSSMFTFTDFFNQDITGWDVGSGEFFFGMFRYAEAFNQDISGWDLSMGVNLSSMFFSATLFNHNLGNWDISNAANMQNMLDQSGLSVENYDLTLIGWNALATVPSGITLGAEDVFYCSAETARMELINDHGWTIIDGGEGCPAGEIAVFEGNDTSGTEILSGQAEAIDFGYQVLATDINFDITIANQGTADIDISSISITGSAFYLSSTPPAVVSAGDAETITIVLSGASAGVFTETVTIENDDLDESTFTFDITGTITATAQPEIVVYNEENVEITDEQTTSTYVGSAPEGNDVSTQISIENIGTADLNITDITFTGSAFALANTPPSVIEPSNSITVDIVLDGTMMGTYLETLSILSDDVDEADFSFPVEGEITAPQFPEIIIYDEAMNQISNGQVTAVDFGSINQGEETSLIFTVGNSGDADLEVTDISITGGAFYLTTTLPLLVRVDEGEELFQITLSGADPGTFEETVTVINNDPVDGTFQFTISGEVVAGPVPEITVYEGNGISGPEIASGQSTPLDFGSELQGSDISRFITIENSGDATLDISDISITGNAFELGSSIPTTIGAGSFEPVEIILSGAQPGTFSETLVIDNNDLDESNFEIVLQGFISEPESSGIAVVVNGTSQINGGQISFIDAFVGTEEIQELVITNTGTVPLVIIDIIIDGDEFSLVSELPGPIPSGESTTLLIAFRPISVGPKTASLRIVSESAEDFVAILSASGLSEAPALEIFNVVTTQQNGKHDFLEIRNIEFYPGNRVFIYSRWGNEVYKTTDYNNTNNRFTGVAANGNELAEGTYYYVIELNGGETVENGFFLLRR